MTSSQPQRTGMPPQPATTTFPLQLLLILGTGFLLRLVISMRTGVQIDESRTLFVIDTVAHKGIPLLGSNVLFLVGVPVSYLFAPLAWVFDGDGFLHAVRFGNVLLSTLAVWLTWQIAREFTHRSGIATIAAFLMALDPMNLYWGSLALWYSSMVVLALLVVLFTIRAITIPDEAVLRRFSWENPVFCLVICLVAGSFTYYSIWLLVPGIVIAGFLRWGREVLAARHPLRLGLEAALIAAVLVWWLGTAVGPGADASFNPGPPSVTQIWNNLDRLREFSFNFTLWKSLYEGSPSSLFGPVLIAVASGMIGGWLMWRSGSAGVTPAARNLRVALAVLLCSYWLPVIILADGSQSPLLLPVLPLGYLLVALGLWLVVPDWAVQLSRNRIAIARPVIAALLLLLPLVVSAVQGAQWRLEYNANDPDYMAGTEYVLSEMQPGQELITPFATAAWLTMSDEEFENVVLLAGNSGSVRARSESRPVSGGGAVDYWSGTRAIASKGSLCGYMLKGASGSWLLVDSVRLDASWGFRGEFEQIIRGATTVVTEGDHGLQIRQPSPQGDWSDEAKELCGLKQGE